MLFASLDAAVDEMLDMLILPADEHTRELLRVQLSEWLVPREEELAPPQADMVSAILTLSKTP